MTQPHSPVSSPEVGDEGASVSREAHGEIRVRLFARTDVGQVREHNEDNFLVADLTRRQRGLHGGQPADDRSGRTGRSSPCATGWAAPPRGDREPARGRHHLRADDRGARRDDPGARDELARRLVRAIEAAGLRIFQEAKLDRTRRGMGTTVTAAALVDDHPLLRPGRRLARLHPAPGDTSCRSRATSRS